MYRFILCISVIHVFYACNEKDKKVVVETQESKIEYQILNETALVILGTVQDAGSPQIACPKSCCKDLDKLEVSKRRVSALGIIDPDQNKKYLIDATPDIQRKSHLEPTPLPSSCGHGHGRDGPRPHAFAGGLWIPCAGDTFSGKSH